MWYQGTELLGWGVQPERQRQRAAGCLRGLDTERGPSVCPAFCLCIPSRLTDNSPGRGWFWGLSSKRLFLDTVLIVNPLCLNSGTLGLSEVMEVTFQISQQNCYN